MAITVRFRRGSTAESNSFVGEEGELYIDKDKDTVVVHDGIKAGGFPLATEAWVSQAISNYSALTISEIDNANTITNQVNNVSAIRFDKDTGFNVENLGNGTVKVKLGSSWKTWKVAGQTSLVAVGEDTVSFVAGTNMSITTNATAKTITFNSTSSFSGSYTDLTNKPTLFSGSYTDLTNKPTIPTVPTTLSSFTNDSGYITGASLTWANITNKPTIPSTNNPTFTGLLNADSIRINNLLTLPTTLGSNGQVLMSDGAGNAVWGFGTPGPMGIAGPAGTPEGSFLVQSSSFNAVSTLRYLVDTTSVAITATLPATPNTGEAIYFVDGGGNYSTNNLTVNRNGNTIMGLSEDLTVDTNNSNFGLVWSGTTWRIY